MGNSQITTTSIRMLLKDTKQVLYVFVLWELVKARNCIQIFQFHQENLFIIFSEYQLKKLIKLDNSRNNNKNEEYDLK